MVFFAKISYLSQWGDNRPSSINNNLTKLEHNLNTLFHKGMTNDQWLEKLNELDTYFPKSGWKLKQIEVL